MERGRRRRIVDAHFRSFIISVDCTPLTASRCDFPGQYPGAILDNVLRVAQEASGWVRFALTTTLAPAR